VVAVFPEFPQRGRFLCVSKHMEAAEMHKNKPNKNLILIACVSLLTIAGISVWLLLDGKPDNRPVVESRVQGSGSNLR
jgi:hypothetical protein